MRLTLRSPRTVAAIAIVIIAAAVAAFFAFHSNKDTKSYGDGKRTGNTSVPDPLATTTKKLPRSLNADEATGAVAPADSVLTAFFSLTGDKTSAASAWSFLSGMGNPNNGLNKTTYRPSPKVTAVGYSATPSPKVATTSLAPNDYPFLDTVWLVTDSRADAKAEVKRFDHAKTVGRDPLFVTVHGTVVVVSASAAEQKIATTAKTLGTSDVWESSHDKHAETGALWMNPYGYGHSIITLATHEKQGALIAKALDGYIATNFNKQRTWTASLVTVNATTSTWKGTWTGGSALPTNDQIQSAQTAATTDPIANNDGGGGKNSGGAVTCKVDPCVTFGQGGDYVSVIFQSSSNLNSGVGGKVNGPDGKRVSPRTQWISFLANDMLAGVANGAAAQSISPSAVHAALNPDHSLLVTLTTTES